MARYFRKRVRAEQGSGGDGLRLGGGPRGQRDGDRLNPVILNGRCLRAGRPQRRPGGAAESLGVVGGVAVGRAAEPDREDQRGGQLAAAGDLGELIGFAGSAKRGERVGEGPAERFVNAVRAGCDARAVRGLRNPDDKDVGLGRSGRRLAV